MTAVGEPHENWKTLLLQGSIEPKHVAAFGNLLGTLHAQSRTRAAEFSRFFADRSFFELLRLDAYYQYTAVQVPEARSFLAKLTDDTLACREAVVHGDYSPKNVVIFQDKPVLLDFEVIHWGDPAFDVGFGMTHLLSKANHLPEFRVAFVAAANSFWKRYTEAAEDVISDTKLDGRAVRHTLGCLLARVAGKSPLEYLDAGEKALQKKRVL